MATVPCDRCDRGTVLGTNGQRWRCTYCDGTGRVHTTERHSMTKYVVLRQGAPDLAETGAWSEVNQIEAANAEQACRKVADAMADGQLADGVTLVAVPARNWTSGRNTFRAETQRKLLRS